MSFHPNVLIDDASGDNSPHLAQETAPQSGISETSETGEHPGWDENEVGATDHESNFMVVKIDIKFK